MSLCYEEILENLNAIDPVKYGKTRNYLDGAVTELSPYISRGVISTKIIVTSLFKRGYKFNELEPILKQLLWRDYFQRVWIHLKEDINKDIKSLQIDVESALMPKLIIDANTHITAIDDSINFLYTKGYMHNHARLYVASLCCNMAKCHWYVPAKWMYYHLLDADWASNALSWQWVAGTFSSKKYFANQENINKYSKFEQKNTILDKSYDELANIGKVAVLNNYDTPNLDCQLPETQPLSLDYNLPIYLYNFYNLDPVWDNTADANRVLLLEPEFFKQYPVSSYTIDFILQLSKQIKGIQLFVGSFNELYMMNKNATFHFKEHPTNSHYKGIEHSRDWICEDINEYCPSFFNYWKKCLKQLKQYEFAQQN